MTVWVLLILGAVLPFLFDASLSSTVALLWLSVFATTACSRQYRIICLLPLSFLLVSLAINHRLAQRLPLSQNGSVHVINGTVASLPRTHGEVVRFVFLPDRPSASIPRRVRVSWYRRSGDQVADESVSPTPRAGERWRLNLELRLPRGRINFHGIDTERWLFADGIGALAYVQKGGNVRLAGSGALNLQHWRESVRYRLEAKAGDTPGLRVLAALAIADRREMLARDREILSATGTGHLLAISGLHIGLAAAMGFYLGRMCLLFVCHGLRQRIAVVLPWLTAWLAAMAYSALSGFGISTQRALIMLTVAAAVVLSRRNVHPMLGWLIAMTLVLAADPFAPLRAGFWFSFTAVAVLMWLFIPRHGRTGAWRRMLMAQAGISLIMAPLGMYWFQQASLPGLLANLVAIPVISMLVVPLVLIALPLLWLPGPLSGWLLGIAGHSSHCLLQILDHLSNLQPPAFGATRAPGLGSTLLAVLGAAIVLLPRGTPGRYAGLLLMLPMMLPSATSVGKGQLQIDFLDVGQGLAILLTTDDYQLLYDTGPGNGRLHDDGWDMVRGTIQPMIKATGRSPDRVVASHADLDHAGGLERLRATYKDAIFLASLPAARKGILPCHSPASWMAGGLEFRVLHPSPGLPYLGNDSSCVVSVKGNGLSLLLGGDISRVVEQRLALQGLQPHEILVAPHHGSSTSSSKALIDAVMPSLVLISAGADNRFGFPREEVLARFAKAGISTLNTAHCGGIRIMSGENGRLEIRSARIQRKSIWRWPAEGNCEKLAGGSAQESPARSLMPWGGYGLMRHAVDTSLYALPPTSCWRRSHQAVSTPRPPPLAINP